jgi:amino acid transporter
VFPGFLGQVKEKYHTPYNATIVFGLLNLVFLWGANLLTASAAVWYYRRVIRSSTSNSFIVARTGHAPFYTGPTTSHGDHIEEELAATEAP